jgi:biopolymer transport protein ExbD
MMQQGFGVQLPQSSRSTAVSAPLTITVPLTFRQDNRVRLDKESVSLDVLAERVRQVLSDRLDKSVLLSGDGEVTYGELIRVFDRLKEGGVERLGLQTQPVISEPRR